MGILKLSDDLRSVYLLELRLGNEVESVDEPAGTECPLAVRFKHPLHFAEITQEVEFAPTVTPWESRDWHFPEEAGYFSKESHHLVAGPLKERRA